MELASAHVCIFVLQVLSSMPSSQQLTPLCLLTLQLCYVLLYESRDKGVPQLNPLFAYSPHTCALLASQLCYVSSYESRDKGVLVQMGQEQLGHFPLGLFDEAMQNPEPVF